MGGAVIDPTAYTYGGLSLSDALLILSIVGPLAFSLARVLATYLLSLLPEAKRATLEKVVRDAVVRVEQSYGELDGKVKERVAYDIIAAMCRKFRIKADPDLIKTFLEVAVNQLTPPASKTKTQSLESSNPQEQPTMKVPVPAEVPPGPSL